MTKFCCRCRNVAFGQFNGVFFNAKKKCICSDNLAELSNFQTSKFRIEILLPKFMS